MRQACVTQRRACSRQCKDLWRILSRDVRTSSFCQQMGCPLNQKKKKKKTATFSRGAESNREKKPLMLDPGSPMLGEFTFVMFHFDCESRAIPQICGLERSWEVSRYNKHEDPMVRWYCQHFFFPREALAVARVLSFAAV